MEEQVNSGLVTADVISGEATRVFKWKDKGKDITLSDPSPSSTPEEVIELYSLEYPELVAGKIKSETPDFENGKVLYTIETKFGTNG